MQQVKSLIANGVLKPGDRLPAERALAERFGVGRSHIREALKRLEFCGILHTMPQSGTVVANSGTRALETLIGNVLEVERNDFRALVETRALLEIQAAKLAAIRASDGDLAELEMRHQAFCKQIRQGDSGLDANVRFHLKIAEAAGNAVLAALVRLLAPEIVATAKHYEVPGDGRSPAAAQEHEAIVAAIRSRDADSAGLAMEAHMRMARMQLDVHVTDTAKPLIQADTQQAIRQGGESPSRWSESIRNSTLLKEEIR